MLGTKQIYCFWSKIAPYCDYLKSLISQGLIEVRSGVVYAAPDGTDPYCGTNSIDADSQTEYSGGVFSVRTKAGRDMSDDPMVEVSYYGSVAYCNWLSQQERKELCYDLSTWEFNFTKHGYRLATQAELGLVLSSTWNSPLHAVLLPFIQAKREMGFENLRAE
jgi:hypothetical protein